MGSLYLSVNSTDPALILGFGTWSRVGNKALWATLADSWLGQDVGTNTHTHTCGSTLLTTNQIPPHTHLVTGETNETGSHDHGILYYASTGVETVSAPPNAFVEYPRGVPDEITPNLITNAAGNHHHTISIQSQVNSSGNQGHDHTISTEQNIPLSLCIAVFIRIQ